MYKNPFIEAPQAGVYYVTGEPETIKADCKDGVFLSLGQKPKIKDGNKTVPNPEAKSEMLWQVVKYVNFPQPAVLFPKEGGERKLQQWVQVFYIDTDGLLCATLLKGESRDNFLKAVRDCEARKKKSFVFFQFKAVMSERNSAKHGSDYFAVSFEVSELDPETFERNRLFAETSFDDIYDGRTVREFYAQNSANAATQPLTSDMAAKLMFALGYIPSEKIAALASGSDTVMLLPETTA